MPLEVPEFWIWDSWIAQDGPTYHLYFLQAPRALGEGHLRHTAAQIGHASSLDLREWTYHGIALGPGEPGSWDDLALWTGSTVRGDDGVWRMFYTAINTRGHGVRSQKIGVVESTDLHNWRRVSDQPLLEADPRWYQTLGDPADLRASETWRDPFVFREPAGAGWHMYICARQPGAERFDDGVIGYATSPDLRTWQLQPPAAMPAGFGQIEVAQARLVQGQPVLAFTCHPDEQAQATKERFGEFCTWSIPGASLIGPWDIAQARPFTAEPDLFAAPLVADPSGQSVLVGFVNLEPKGLLSFDIIDPIPVRLAADGTLEAVPGYQPVGPALLSKCRPRTDLD
ncbi:MAG: glycosyl hydrolase [Candidatus Nanopelagicales bacterium]